MLPASLQFLATECGFSMSAVMVSAHTAVVVSAHTNGSQGVTELLMQQVSLTAVKH